MRYSQLDLKPGRQLNTDHRDLRQNQTGGHGQRQEKNRHSGRCELLGFIWAKAPKRKLLSGSEYQLEEKRKTFLRRKQKRTNW
jgi:hypothetical protein